jgi:hypothetical protein
MNQPCPDHPKREKFTCNIHETMGRLPR